MATDAISQAAGKSVNPYIQQVSDKYKSVQKQKNQLQQSVNASSDDKNAGNTRKKEIENVALANSNSKDKVKNLPPEKDPKDTAPGKRIDIYA